MSHLSNCSPVIFQSTSGTYVYVNYNTDVVLVNASAGNTIVVMPTIDLTNKSISIKKIDSSANTVTVVGSNGATIDSLPSLTICEPLKAVTLTNNETGWYIF